MPRAAHPRRSERRSDSSRPLRAARVPAMQTRWLAVVFGVAACGVAACGVSNDHLGEVAFPDPPGLVDGGVTDASPIDGGPIDGRPPDGRPPSNDAGLPDGDIGFPDGGVPPDAPGGGSDVHGVAIDLHAVAPATVVPVPQDLSTFVVQAYVPDGSPGGFRVLDAEHTGGSFTIRGVPAGSYDLLVVAPGDPVPHFYQTASRALDLGVFALGRVNGPLATLPTRLTFHLTSGFPDEAQDLAFVDSFSNGGEILTSPPFDPLVIDWRDTLAPLLNAASADDLFVTHQRRLNRTDAGQSQRLIVEAFSTRSLTLVNGQDTSVTGSLTPPPSGFVQVEYVPSSFIEGHDVPVHQPISMLWRMRAGLIGAVSQGAQILDIGQRVNASQQLLFAFGTFNDPYPLEWPRFVFESPQTFWNYAARGTTQTAIYFGNTFARVPLPPFTTFAIHQAPFPAPRGIRLQGVDASTARAVEFDGIHAVAIEWLPVVGVSHYAVTASQITSDGSFATLTPIATFDTTAPIAVMPPSLFAVGGSYVFSVASVVDPTTDYAGGTLRRQGFPIAVHDAVTARVLFAGSCGNGVVDAPFEQCDSGGIATATCNPDCTRPVCGDGFTNPLAHEQCDDAGDSAFCNADCTRAACGDGRVHIRGGEECDDGSANSFDGCSADCFIEAGFVCNGEPSVCTFVGSQAARAVSTALPGAAQGMGLGREHDAVEIERAVRRKE
ncbi:MAG TPA: myxococcus cysteine-rich repeat containing protein [Kofleriaceae bacterium]|nr:myxococcus cysteine-rich repeat containing protein [Kofleriaceae bacterium]